MEAIILASSSPRRQEILKKLNIPYKVMIPDIDESQPADIETSKLPEYLAAKKVEAIVRLLQDGQEITWVLGADTVVVKDGTVYGKPADRTEANRFLHELQGQTHQVITSLALFNGKLFYLSTRTCVSSVTMAPMTDEEIEAYLDTGEWHGVAGGYRVQELGSCFIQKIDGSSSAIAGLPIFELYDMLKEQGYLLFAE